MVIVVVLLGALSIFLGTENGSKMVTTFLRIKPPIPQPSLTYSLAKNTPKAATVFAGSVNVAFISFNLTVNDEEDFNVKSIEIKRFGIGSVSDFGKIKLFDGATQIGSAVSLNSGGIAKFEILSYKIPAGTIKVFTIMVDINSKAESGHQNGFNVSAISAYPEHSNKFTVSGNAVGNIISIK